MELGRGTFPGVAPRPGLSPESEVLLNILRPHCMATMMAMEHLLSSAGKPASAGADQVSANGASQVAPDGASAAGIAAGRWLEASITALHLALGEIVAAFPPTTSTRTASSTSSSSYAHGYLPQLVFPSALPYVMLPLELVITPPGGRTTAAGGAGGEGGGRATSATGGGGRRGRGVPVGAREKAFRCVVEAVRGSGSRFVEGYGIKPTIHMLIRLIFTLSECSPMTDVVYGQQSQNGSSSGSAPPTVARGREEDSGLTAGTDALRLACLECLEAVLRAPFAAEAFDNNVSSNSQPAWSEVRNGLKDAVGGGMLAQLVQELLLCCQQGGVPPAAATTAATAETGKQALANGGGDATTKTAGAGGGGRARMWGGAEEARAAAGCLDALCLFTPDTTAWRRLLPGTFSGLFRAIRGIRVGSGLAGSGGDGPGGIGATLALGGSPGSSVSRASGGVSDGGRGGGGSKSALAEACLGVLGKVLLVCAGGGRAEHASDAPASCRSFGVDGGRGRERMGVGGTAELSNDTSTDNPLMTLQRLAMSSNASSRTAEVAQDHMTGAAATASIASPVDRVQSEAPLPKATPSASAAAATATAAVIAVEDPEWGARTSDRLRLLLPPLLAFCCLHPGWRVRRATAKLAADLLRTGCGDGDEDRRGSGAGGPRVESGGGGGSGLLKPLTALLVEALVGLLLDDMPQVSGAARKGLVDFRAALTPFRWLELRGILLERLCTIAEGLPVLAKSADEKRLRAAFDLLAGYLALLRFDAQAALDGRLSVVLSCLCEALEFDGDFNVQVLEGSSNSSSSSSSSSNSNSTSNESGTHGHPQPTFPKYYRQMLANVREDSTLSSARRAVRLLGKFCDLASLAEAAISSLESRPPRPPPPPPAPWRAPPQSAVTGSPAPTVAAGGPEPDFSRGSGNHCSSRNDAVYRRRCLKWLRLRLPLAWVFNQALLGRVPGLDPGGIGGGGGGGGGDASVDDAAETEARPAAGFEGQRQDDGRETAASGTAAESFLGRDLAVSLLERILASHAFALPVSRAEAAAAGYSGNYANGEREEVGTADGGAVAKPPRALEYTRSGAVLGGGVGGARSRSSWVSGQVLDANATLVSTVVEALGSLAEASGPDCGEAFLRRALFTLLEKAASTHPVVSQAALATLSRVRSACGGFDDMSQLLEANMDYVIDDVVRRVSSSSRRNRGVGNGSMDVSEPGRGLVSGGSGIPSVVEAVLRIGGSVIGPALVRDLAGVTLREVDACAWDPRQARRSLGVLRAVASCVTLPPLSPAEHPSPLSPSKWEDQLKGGPGERDNHGKGPRNDGNVKTQGGGSSALAESPWFRHLFVEFADTPDIRRVEEASSAAGEGQGAPMSALLQAVKDHREAMGFDMLDGDRENETDRNKARWRETEQEARKAAGQRGIEEEEEEGRDVGQLPEPDAEGRRMAESEEVKTLSEVLARSCHFLATPSLETQAMALACMRDCVVKLASAGADAALLPHAHRAWRPLMASLREHLTPIPPAVVTDGSLGGMASLSSRRAVLLHALDTVDALVDVCGDFLSDKLAEDLWPLLRLLLLQYASSTTAGGSNGNDNTLSSAARSKGKSIQSTLFSSSSSLSPSPPGASPAGLFLVGSKLDGRVNGFTGGAGDREVGGNGGSGGVGSLLVVPPRASSGGGVDESATGWMGGSGSGGWNGGGRKGTLGEKVVARALESLERLCGSDEYERFMTPLAREVALAALPCLSSAGPEPIRSRAEGLFRRLSFLDGDGVWLLLQQTMDTATRQPNAQRQQLRASLGARAPTSAGRGKGTGGRSRVGKHVARPRQAGPRTSFLWNKVDLGGSANISDSDARWWLPSPSVDLGTSLAGEGSSRRPAVLLEGRALFGGGEGGVVGECAPAAARLLDELRADGAVAEHM
eukprot:g11582.t1